MEKSGIREAKWLFFVLMISHVCLGFIWELNEKMATGGIWALVFSALIALGIVFFTEQCLGCIGCKGFKSHLGNRGYTLLATVLFILTLLNAARRMKDFSSAIGSVVLLQSPGVLILLIMSLAAFFVGILGLEAITRYSLVASGVFFVFAGALFVTNLPRAEVINLYPMGGKNGFSNPISGLYVFSDWVYFFFVKYSINNNKKIKYPLSGTIITVALTGIAIYLFYCLCVPYPASTMYKYPLYRLSLLANSSVVFQRMDGLVYLIWIFFSFICQGAYVLFSVCIFGDALELKNQKAITASVAFLCFLIALTETEFGNYSAVCMVIFSFLIFPGYALWIKKGRKRNV